MRTIAGLHHVTAIASDPQANLDFYRGVLGLRLVKLTVNFDDPTSYHFYYGDGLGHPGTILTFFAWPGGRRGKLGTGQTAATGFTITPEALPFWRERLTERGIAFNETAPRFDEQRLSFADPDGLTLELVAHPHAAERAGWVTGPLPGEAAIRGLHAVTLREAGGQPTQRLLTETLGFTKLGENGALTRYATGGGGPGSLIDVAVSDPARGMVAVGTVHHVAWRTPDDAEQAAWLAQLTDEGHPVSPIMDRQYFHSIYFREPGGVLFEIATDPPGFATDETPEHLGEHLKLPPWLEVARADIEADLPKIVLHSEAAR